MTELDAVTAGLEGHFRAIQNDLVAAAHRLDCAFDSADAGSPHPLKLLRRVAALQEAVAKMEQDWETLEQDREQKLPGAIEALQENSKALEQLSLVAGCLESEYKQIVTNCVATLQSQDPTASEDADENADPNDASEEPLPPPLLRTGVAESAKQRGEGPEPYNRQKTLDEESFNTLPSSIRSRVPFTTVQQAFTIMSALWAEGNKKMVRNTQYS